MASKITYENKVGLENDETIQRKNKVIDADMNEIKNVVNGHADDLTQKDVELADIKKDSNNILRGVEEVEKLTSTGTWANRTWRSASGGTGTRERIDVENPPNSNFKKGWRFTSTVANNHSDVAQDLVPATNNQTYKISCYARKISGEPILRMQYGKGIYYSQIYKVDNTDWKKYIFEFVIGEKNDGSSDGSTNIYFGIDSCIGALEICGLCLEKVDERITTLENENEYLKELNSSLQETVLDTQTEIAETVIVNDSCERHWNGKYPWWTVSKYNNNFIRKSV